MAYASIRPRTGMLNAELEYNILSAFFRAYGVVLACGSACEKAFRACPKHVLHGHGAWAFPNV